MDYRELQKLISSDESRVLELKKTTGELKDAMHTACAFLNTDGGWLIFGVAPASLKVVGQQVTDNTQREIAQALSGLEPAIDVQVEYIDVPDAKAGEKVIAIHFDGWVWGSNPYTYHGCPYYRIESTTKQMPRDMYDERLKAAKPDMFAWERQIADGYTIEDLDEKRIQGVIRLGIQSGRMPSAATLDTIEEVLTKWELVIDGHPTNGAVALFGKRVNGFPQLMLKMARFRGMDKMSFIDNQCAYGNYFDLMDAGMAFLFKHLNLSGEIKGFVREEHLDIPAEALREALTNALCHRQYEKYNLCPSIAIYDDRVEIDNPGRLPNQLTVDSIKLPHPSFPYNLQIARVLYMSTFLESWGSGVKRMVDLCIAGGLPEPEYSQQLGFVTVSFKKKKEVEGEKIKQIITDKLSIKDKIVDKLSLSSGAIDKMVAIMLFLEE
ncbi:MAG: putative DNA binding domain-containing protein, partial [Paludibacteraceae bacterium]|nr:putative DNA binding domain-containing protein [Paludibacteraceae bacterium]